MSPHVAHSHKVFPCGWQECAVSEEAAAGGQVLYTNPVTPRAGEEVTVFYNPDITVLRGRPEIYLRGSWNRHANRP